MANAKKLQKKVFDYLDEFVLATHGHSHALMMEDNKAQDFYMERLDRAVDGLLAAHPNAILVLEPVARDEDTFMAVEAAGYLSLHRPEVGLPLLNHLYETTRGTYNCVYAGFWLRRCEEKAKRAGQGADSESPPAH